MQDIFETMVRYVDALKFAGGSFSLIPRSAVQDLVQYCYDHGVLVSTGGFIERVLTWRPKAVDKYIDECGEIGFDIIEISRGFITVPVDDVLRLIEKVQRAGMKAKPEVGIQFGAGGTTAASELEAEGAQDIDWAVDRARRYLDAGAYNDHDRIGRNCGKRKSWRTDVPAVSSTVSELKR